MDMKSSVAYMKVFPILRRVQSMLCSAACVKKALLSNIQEVYLMAPQENIII